MADPVKNICVLGNHGLIGTALVNAANKRHINVQPYPDEDTDVIFDMASPTHQVFEKNFFFHASSQVHRLLTLLPFVKEHGIKYVFPSSALVYEKDIPFVHVKIACEELIRGVKVDHIIARIWPTYGDEAHKGQFASVIYQWDKMIQRGVAPVVFADGTQRRAFVSTDMVAEKLLNGAMDGKKGTFDIVGKERSFNEIIDELNERHGKKIKPTYTPAPEGYSMVSPRPQMPEL